MAEKKSQNPAHPDASPTAPGGMSQKALIKELVEQHGYEGPVDSPAWKQVPWPDLIDLVVDERLAAEKVEEPTEQDIMAEHEGESVGAVEEALVDAGLDPSDDPEEVDEFDALLAEMDMPDDEAEVDALVGAEAMGALPEDATSSIEDDEYADDYVRNMAAHTPDSVTIEMDADLLDPEMMFNDIVQAQEEYDATLPPPLFLGIPGVRDYIFDGHAGAGPSGSERWMNCTMSLTASRAFLETLTPNQQAVYATAGTAAQQGTTAHSVGEAEANHMLGRIETEELDNTLLDLAATPEDDDVAYDEEMAEYVAEYVALVTTYATERGGDAIGIEERVGCSIPLTGSHEGEVYVIRGSLDFSANPTPEHNTLVVGDLKYGKGLEVDVDENPQIREYALGKLEQMIENGEDIFALDGIDYYIIQPRLGGIKKWSESVDDLLAWRDDVLAPALTKALYGEAEGATFEPSDLACQWCPARGGCPALTKFQMDNAAQLFDAVIDAEVADGLGSMPEPSAMDNDTLGDLLAQARAIEGLAKSLREEAQRRLHRGEPVKGFHLVSYTPKRDWKDEYASDPVAMLNQIKGLTTDQKRKLFKPRTLVSPTQAEKILKDDFTVLGEVIEVPDKRPVISTGAKDRRKAWEGKAPEAMFEIEEDE